MRQFPVQATLLAANEGGAMESLNGRPSGRLLPKARAHETNRELVWEVELPAPDTLSVSLEGRRLTVRITHRVPEHAAWHLDPDATAV
jgi:hypothetical protein